MTEVQPRSLPSLDATVFLRLLLEDEDVLKEPTTFGYIWNVDRCFEISGLRRWNPCLSAPWEPQVVKW